MKSFERLVQRVRTALRHRHRSRKPVPKPVREENSTIQIQSPPPTTRISESAIETPTRTNAGAERIQLPPPATRSIESAIEAPIRTDLDAEQIQLLPPITRTSESVWEAPIRTSIDTEQIQETPQKPQLSIQPSTQTSSGDRLSPSGWSSRSSRGTSISSQASTSRDSSCSKDSTSGRSLSAQLRRARIECHQRPHSFFVPICDQESLITIPNIEKEIQDRDHFIGLAEVRNVAKEAFGLAPRVFAILACLKRGPEIRFLLREGVSDRDLPFERRRNQDGDFVLYRKSGEVIKTFESWSDVNVEEFDRIQWWMISPVFKVQGHYDLEDGTILPFIPFRTNSDTDQKKEGGYSEVYAAKIHPSHHNFWPHSELEDNEPLVAVKRLFSSDEIEFQKEVTILEALDSKEKHPHLITLLATFKHKRKYHLVFRYANANLRKYWKDRPSPSFDKATILWSLKQMAGMAHALESIHNFSVQYPLTLDGKVRLHKDATLYVEKYGELFGRHGDIKPENILWFQHIPGIEDENGALQLADFGLGSFHGRDSRSKVPCDEIAGSPTYEPPECKLHRPVSRAYDIWSIGCLYLEFITWLLKGSASITGFSSARGKTATSTATNDDHFFTIIGDDAVVREEVVVWVQQLHEHESCSALIHELLDIIMEDLLRPKSEMRVQARWLFYRLAKCLEKATADRDYLLKPVPGQQKLNFYVRANSAPIVPDALKKKRKSVAFENQGMSSPSSEAQFKPLNDPVGRNAGTPGLLKRSRTYGTWLPHGLSNG